MNSAERAAKVMSQADYAEQALQIDVARGDAQPRLKIAEDILIEGLSVSEYNDYIRGRVALAHKFAAKLN